MNISKQTYLIAFAVAIADRPTLFDRHLLVLQADALMLRSKKSRGQWGAGRMVLEHKQAARRVLLA
jgi:hypothetical protein